MTINICEVAQEFTDYLNEWHTYSQPYDTKLDIWLHEAFAQEMRKYKKMDWSAPYFSPSSSGKDDRELYVKALRMKKDEDEVKPWQRRYTSRGTSVGDWLQRELLLAERHFEKFTGKLPPFKFERTAEGYPAFEEFVHGQKFYEHNGNRFSILGTCDGILEYVNEDGERKRIGLEIKSKQTSYAETGFQRMKEAKDDHVKQVTCYALNYELDAYLVIYVNCSVKAWFMTDEEWQKAPDIRVFGIEVTDEMKDEILTKFASITAAVKSETPPPLALEKFRFNNFKESCALSLTDEEYAQVKDTVRQAMRSSLPDWKKRGYMEAYEIIRDVREGEAV
ncbi:hypothetical protein [Peribacillus huizhouensis]|uniref:YqaJ viral recombinase domain-containing protein n=1 Tax=Peribacillus huizhouensis TaxID=1501239 RepID=A0ABR6CRA1_9BACI|nr:hypothetical protein [Peribacillus huizhouensis]MBA9027559.1 hypothetical protein [Peribacillus huizhouensis]